MIQIDLSMEGGRRPRTDPLELLRARLLPVAVGAAAVVALGAGLLMQRGLTAEGERIVAERNRQIALADTLGELRRRSEEIVLARSGLDSVSIAVARLDRDRYAWPRFMDAVARAVPSSVWVDRLQMETYDEASGSVAVRVRGFGPSLEAVNRFAARLESTSSVRDVQLLGTASVPIGAVSLVRFDLSAVSIDPGMMLVEVVR